MKVRAARCQTCNMESVWLSWSRLRTHEECKQQAYLKRTGKKATIDNHRNFLPGNVSDRVVRDWLLGDPWNSLGTMKDMVPEYLDRAVASSKEQGGVILWKGNSDRSDIIRDCIEAVTTVEQDLIEKVLPYEYAPDYAFKSTLEVPVRGRDEPIQIVLNGYMDILVKKSETSYSIHDLKHTKNESYWKKTIGQLAFYDTALRLAEGCYSDFASLLQPLCKVKERTFDITNDDRIKMWQSIQNYAQDYADMNVEPTSDTNACSMCNVKHACVRFKAAMKNGKRVVSL